MYKKILVPLDGSELAECVLPHVEELCRAEGERTLYLIQVVEPFQPFVGDYVLDPAEVVRIDREHRLGAARYLEGIKGRLKCEKATVEFKVIEGRVAETLADFAGANEIDLIVIATHGRSGVSRWVRGSVADRILHFSSIPILMIRAPWLE